MSDFESIASKHRQNMLKIDFVQYFIPNCRHSLIIIKMNKFYIPFELKSLRIFLNVKSNYMSHNLINIMTHNTIFTSGSSYQYALGEAHNETKI